MSVRRAAAAVAIAVVLAFAGACDDDPTVPPPVETSRPAPATSSTPDVTPLALCPAIIGAVPAGLLADPRLVDLPHGTDTPRQSRRQCLVEDYASGSPHASVLIVMERHVEGVPYLNHVLTDFMKDGCGRVAASADPTGLSRCTTTGRDSAVIGAVALVSSDRFVGVQVTVYGDNAANRRKVEEAAPVIARKALDA